MLNEFIDYHASRLTCEGIPLATIAEKVGTPVYVYSAGRILHNLSRVREAFNRLGASIHYSLKANANLALIRLLDQQGTGMDAVSAGEIYRAQQAGVDPRRIVFAGVGKTRAEIAYALDAGVGWFNVESEAELALLNILAGERGQVAPVALRVNPGIQAQTHRHIATGHGGAKFGLEPEIVAEILASRKHYDHVRIAGLHLHIGSQLASVAETAAAVKVAQSLLADYSEIRTLNIGGGFPVYYTGTESYPSLEDFVAALRPLLRGWQVMIEPGRSIVADAGLLLVSVLYNKRQGGRRFVIVDGSMTDLIRPALYDAVHPVVPVRRCEENISAAVVAGPVCETADMLNTETPLPPLESGDLLAVMGAGAYGIVMASNYNMRTRAPEVLVAGDSWRVIRRRETWDDLLRLEAL